MKRYNPKEIEPKWRKIWQESGIYKTSENPGKDKFYCLAMFPYPSGNLHVGHWYNFGPADTVARFHRMTGKKVMHPIGYDSFGLPAENAAIKNNVPPAEWTRSNIETMTKQLEAIGAMYDWDKLVVTSDPEYYRWTQWLFLKLYEKGLAYRKEAPVNWCPSCQTVLANEQVVGDDNHCERCDTVVEQKMLNQWYFKITDYAERLLNDAEDLDWPDRVQTMQRNWIGRSVGAEIEFEIESNLDNAVVVHGQMSSPKTGWRPWLVERLESGGIKAVAPEFPSTQNNKLQDWTEVFDKQKIDENTVLVGHSRGAMAILRWLEKAPLDTRVGKVVLVAPNHHFQPERKDSDKFYSQPLDFEKLKVQCHDYTVIHSRDDDQAPYEAGVEITEGLGAQLISLDGRGHFGKEESPTVPEILEAIKPSLEVFTTRPDTLLGATYMVLAPEHPLVRQIATKSQLSEVKKYIKETEGKTELDRKLGEKDKTGVFTGAYAVNPVNKEKIPIWIADYVLMSYGTGAIMAVPAHDQRDFEFAKANNLEIIEVVKPKDKEVEAGAYFGEGVMVNSGKYDGMQSDEAREAILKDLESEGVATEKVNYKLRDWLISRQRYWGAPIPIVYCDDCGEVPIPTKDLPVKLPEDVEFEPTGKSPLLAIDDFVSTNCPKCGGSAKRETDTMDTFVDSSWYYLRYPNTKYENGPFDPQAVAKWGQVDHYIGGIEHAILHLLYSRFITKVLHDHADLPFEEPFKKLTNQGMILGPDGYKMSKSKGNVVDPDKQVGSYGTDSLRLYLMFMGPYEQGGPYNMTGITGTRRFIERVWMLVGEFADADTVESADLSDVDLQVSTHRTIKKVTEDLLEISFNTAISALMQQVNHLNVIKAEHGYSHKEQWQETLNALVLLLAPLAPHVAEEMWQMLGHDKSVHLQGWPVWDEKLMKEDLATIVVQVNGKVRANIEMLADVSDDEMAEIAKKDEKIQRYLKDGEAVKTITVPGKLVNFVVKS